MDNKELKKALEKHRAEIAYQEGKIKVLSKDTARMACDVAAYKSWTVILGVIAAVEFAVIFMLVNDIL